MNVIQRDAFVQINTFKEIIEMSQGTDIIPVIFTFQDYDIPAGTTGIVFVKKPSRKAIQGVAVVNAVNNTVTTNINPQMTAEVGESQIQIQLTCEGNNLFTFNYPLMVSESAIPINSVNGSTFLDEYIRRIEQEIFESKSATNATIAAKDDILQKAKDGEFSATFKVGGVKTADPGMSVLVENVGTKKDVILDFAIPKGDVGPQGPKGDKGVTGPQGAQGSTGAQGPKGEIGGTGPEGPQGIQGMSGPQGQKGESGVTVPISGLFTLAGDADGNLYANYADGSTVPKFEVDSDNNIYYITPDA